MLKTAKALLDRVAKYIAKGLEMGVYTETVGGDLFAERLLDQIRRYRAEARPRVADAKQLLERAIKYVGKGLEMGAYTETVGGDLFAERLLGQLRQFTGAPSQTHATHATKKAGSKRSPAQLNREIAEVLSKSKPAVRSSHAKKSQVFEKGQRVTVFDYLGREIGTGSVYDSDNYPEPNEHYTYVKMTLHGETGTHAFPTIQVRARR